VKRVRRIRAPKPKPSPVPKRKAALKKAIQGAVETYIAGSTLPDYFAVDWANRAAIAFDRVQTKAVVETEYFGPTGRKGTPHLSYVVDFQDWEDWASYDFEVEGDVSYEK
jgi:hypothetical protein